MTDPTRWEFEAELIQSCNCDYGCPCNFNGLPTHGNCEALLAYRIRSGRYRDVSLAGVTLAMAAWWPKAIHQGKGVGRFYIDPSASAEQREAIEAIVSGKNGGGVFEVFPRTWAMRHPSRMTKIDFHYNGYDSWFKVDGIGEVHSEHIKNPVDGAPFEGTVRLPNGIAWKEAIVTNIRRWWVRDEDLLAVHEDRAGFACIVRFSEKGCIG
jgi:hypothetical protein